MVSSSIRPGWVPPPIAVAIDPGFYTSDPGTPGALESLGVSGGRFALEGGGAWQGRRCEFLDEGLVLERRLLLRRWPKSFDTGKEEAMAEDWNEMTVDDKLEALRSALERRQDDLLRHVSELADAVAAMELKLLQ